MIKKGFFSQYLPPLLIFLASCCYHSAAHGEETAAGKIYPACSQAELACSPLFAPGSATQNTAHFGIQGIAIAAQEKSFDSSNNQFTKAIIDRFTTIYQKAHLETLVLQQCLEHRLAGGKNPVCSIVDRLKAAIKEHWEPMRISHALGKAEIWQPFGEISTRMIKYSVPEQNGKNGKPLSAAEEQQALKQLKVLDEVSHQCHRKNFNYLNHCHGQLKDFLDYNFQPQQQKNYLDHLQQAPIMAYLTSQDPSDQELLSAVKKINKNSTDLLTKIRSSNPPLEHLMANSHIINQILAANPQFCPMADSLVSTMARKNQAWMVASLATTGVSIVGCLASVLSVVGMELCAMFLAADTAIAGKNLLESIAQVDHTKTSIFSDALSNELIEDFYHLDQQEQEKAMNLVLFPLAAMGASATIASPMIKLSANARKWIRGVNQQPESFARKTPELELALQRKLPEIDNTICLKGKCFLNGPQKQLDPIKELKQAGTIIRPNDRVALQKVQSQIAERDGVYVYLLDQKGNLIISHRAPNLALDPGQEAYLATHRGLYNQLLKDLNLPADAKHPIVAAGEMRVTGGEVRTVSDQAGSFFQSVTEELANMRQITINPEDQKLIDDLIALKDNPDPFAIDDYLELHPNANKFFQDATKKVNGEKKEKLDVVEDKFRTIQLVSKETKFSPYMGAGDSHYSAGEAAFFELQCNKNPSCAKILAEAHNTNQEVLKHFAGDTRAIEEIGVIEHPDGSYISDLVSRPDMLIKEGGTEWLAHFKQDPALFTEENYRNIAASLKLWREKTVAAAPH